MVSSISSPSSSKKPFSLTLAILNEELGLTAIAYLMGLSWGTLTGCFFGPFVIGLIWKKVSKPAVWTSFIGSLVITVGLIILLGYDKMGYVCSFGLAIKTGIGCSPLIGVICMFYSIIVTIIVSLFTKAPDKEIIDNAFNKQIENEII